MFFDPMYFLIIAPGFILSLWATYKVKSTFNKYSKVRVGKGLSGAGVAKELLRRRNIRGVRVELHEGWLSDHYDPRDRVIRLSPDVYHGQSVSSVGVAAHETGHAIQHAERYAPMALRQTMVAPANAGSTFSWILILAGSLLAFKGLIALGILLFTAVVLFQLVTLPVEFNASSRAKKYLLQEGIVTAAEGKDVAIVLNAAAMTYVAALLTSVLTLLYYVMRFAGASSDD